MNLSEYTVILLHDVNPAWTVAERIEACRDAACLQSALMDNGHPVVSVQVSDADISTLLEQFDPCRHIVLNWCEELPGKAHSEGTVARILDSLGFIYTGSCPDALALSEDKCIFKKRLTRQDIPTPRWVRVEDGRQISWDTYPAIVKAAWEHGSAGLSIDSVVLSPSELDRKITRMRARVGSSVMIEEFIEGREFHVTLWGNGHVKMLPPVEIDFSTCSNIRDRLCTYDSKFRPRSAHYRQVRRRIPRMLSARINRQLARVCKSAYRAIGCRDYARIDVRWRGGVCYVLDVNPNPDIASDSSMACAAAQAGFSYGEMGSRLVALAGQRHPSLADRRRHENKCPRLAEMSPVANELQLNRSHSKTRRRP
ncbi:MAG: hypothetical protein KKE37_03140 [Verrucomicrobia bacterium]|nr:hypothetical protein [Verrucomicrobiota bacterium]MBU4291664.1 hypothetical protein [Verrucomicrobiota bacterium]MBU4428332.1 hypothetical protein [Verrucomicrobiota bacterium]MCG2681085.1 hypothetical protein [Kiritimatiellia bacterium]